MKYSVAIVTVLSLVCCTLADSKPDSNPDHAVNHNHFHFTGQARNGAYNPYGGYPQYGGYPGAYPGAGGYGGYPGGYGGYGGYGAPGGYGGYPSPYGANPYGQGGYGEDPYLHVNKRELVGGALLLGAGIIKGVIATSIFNTLSPNIQIGKK